MRSVNKAFSTNIGSWLDLDTDRFWFALFAAYYIAHICIRVMTGAGLGLDEAEMMLAGRNLEWGYGPQLPLYAWLQWCVFQLTGANIFGLSLLKCGLLFSIVFTLFQTIRIVHEPRISGLTTLFILTIPQFAWEAQRDLSHSVLVTLASVLTLHVIYKITILPRPRYFVYFGFVLAIGGLSKYNYFIIPIALLIAAAFDKISREAVFSRWLFVSVSVGAVFLIRPYLWIYEYQSIALSRVHKLKISENAELMSDTLQGIGALLTATTGFIAVTLIVAVALWLFYRCSENSTAADPLNKFICRFLFIQFVLILIMVIVSHSTFIKDRWLLPNLIFIGPVVALWLIPQISKIGEHRILQVSTVLAALVATMMIPYGLVGKSYRSAPFEEISKEILLQLPPEFELIASNWIAGNLSLYIPYQKLHSLNGIFEYSDSMYLIWQADTDPSLPIDRSTIRIAEAPYHNASNEKLRIAFARASK